MKVLSRRFGVAAIAVLVALAISGSAAAAQPAATPSPALPAGGCAAFGRTQTYQAWGPAAFYDRPVTVNYGISGCDATITGTTFTMTATGTASIVDADTGAAVDSRSFSITGTWVDPLASGWPLHWWSCEVDEADLVWSIDGVYEFRMHAVGGTWILDVSVPGAAPVHYQHASC